MGKVEQLIANARSEESLFSWSAAANAYSEALVLEPEPGGKAPILESLGYALYKAAMQTETSLNFKELIRQSVSSYRRAAPFYHFSKDPSAEGRGLRCRAMASYARFWIGAKRSKRKNINQSWKLAQEALEVFARLRDGLEYCRTLGMLSLVAELANAYEPSSRIRERNSASILKHGRQAIRSASQLGETAELGQTCAMTATLLVHQARIEGQGSKEFVRLREEALELWRRAEQLSPNLTLLQLCNNLRVSSSIIEWTGGSREIVSNYNRSLTEAEKTKDNLSIGIAHDNLASLKTWRFLGHQDLGSIGSQVDEVIAHLNESRAHFKPLSFVSPREGSMWGGAPEAESCWFRALYEIDASRKRRLLEEGEKNLTELMRRARSTQYPNTIRYAHHVSGKVLAALAKLEGETRSKKTLLQRALRHRVAEQMIRRESFEGGGYLFGEGINLGYLGDLKLELSKVAQHKVGRMILLREATEAYEKCIEISLPAAKSYETYGDLSYFAPLANRQMDFAKSLAQLFEASGDRSHLERSAGEFLAAGSSFSKAGPLAWAAECYWRAGGAHDILGEHSVSVDEFDQASAHYQTAAKRVPNFEEFYSELARYMSAWSSIEKAKVDHSQEQYYSARLHYEKASDLHQSIGKWSFLAPNYRAWAELEHGEGLSREDHVDDAIRTFDQAKNLFHEFKNLIRKTEKRLDPEELEMVEHLVHATEQRERYCQARLLIEEARRFENEGDHERSARNYGLAAETLGKISFALVSDKERQEVNFVKRVSEAWQMMERAQAEVDPDLFKNASRLFDKAKAKAPTQRSRMIVSGHSKFSMALRAGRKFEETGNRNLQKSFNHALRQATDFYLKAGLDNAAEYAKATKLVVDAYGYLRDADSEQDLEKKAKNCALAEKTLEAAADSYAINQHGRRKNEVLALLKIARGERELAGSLTQLLHASTPMSTTATLVVPQPTHEEPVGVKRFEGADVRADLTVGQKDLRVGSNLSVEIELVNTGRGFAQLVKVDDAVPPGFEMVGRPSQYVLSGLALDMKGKMLGPLQTAALTFQLRPVESGVAQISPKILYVDESGDYRSFKPPPVEVIVRELYVPEWMKSPLPIHIPPEFMFETERAKQVFQHLVKAFQDDYVTRHLFAEKAGWRSLVELLRESHLPTSAFYGPEGRKGPVLAELERLGLVELRVFPGERGRGGNITRLRLAYANVILRRAA